MKDLPNQQAKFSALNACVKLQYSYIWKWSETSQMSSVNTVCIKMLMCCDYN